MRKILTSALVFAGVMTSASCFAALQYEYAPNTKIFIVKSEDVLPLDDGANQLTVSFTKEYNLMSKRGYVSKNAIPTMHVRLEVVGKNDYKLADNVNYWQDHNYTYEEMGVLKDLEAKRLAAEKAKKEAKQNKQAGKATDEPKADSDKAVFEKHELELRHLRRNPSTLIYLQVDNSNHQVNRKEIFKFSNTSVDNKVFRGINYKKNKHSDQEKQLNERFTLEEAEQKLVEADANEARINEEAAVRMAELEHLKALKTAFEKQAAEQKAVVKSSNFACSASATIPKGDNFWKKVVNSLKMNRPMFFEVKFWNGGANQRIWLKNDKLKELIELINYDLYKDEANWKRLK